MTSYRKINDNTVWNIGKESGKCSCLVRVPYSWLGKKIIARLAEEEKHDPNTEGINPQ